MAIYRQIYMTFWSDPKISENFTPEDRYFYLYLLTNEKTNICGCYEISIKRIVDETGYSKDTVLNLLERMEKVHEVIRYSPETKEVLILNWHKYNWNKSPKLTQAVIAENKQVKNTSFQDYVTYMLYEVPYAYPMDTV